MEKCKGCIHENVREHRANIQTDTYAYMGVKYDTEKCEHYMPADVVPKSEVAKIFEELYNSVASKIQPHIRPICSDDLGFDAGFRNGKTDALLDTLVIIAELKKKYTED